MLHCSFSKKGAVNLYETNPLLNFIVSFLTGILSGFGIGGGTLLIVYLAFFAGVEQRMAQYVNLVYFLPTAAGSMLPHIKNNRIEWRTALPAAVSGCILAYLTASFLRGFDAGLLKRFFGLFLIYIGIREVTAKK